VSADDTPMSNPIFPHAGGCIVRDDITVASFNRCGYAAVSVRELEECAACRPQTRTLAKGCVAHVLSEAILDAPPRVIGRGGVVAVAGVIEERGLASGSVTSSCTIPAFFSSAPALQALVALTRWSCAP